MVAFKKQTRAKRTNKSAQITPMFDKEKIYTKEVLPLLHQVYDLCKKHKLPSLLSVCCKTEKDGFHAGFFATTHDGFMPARMGRARTILEDDKPVAPKVSVSIMTLEDLLNMKPGKKGH